MKASGTLIVMLSGILLGGALARGQEPAPAYWAFSPAPPMGWNSYDAFGDTVTEEEVIANAKYMKEHLLSHGWNYVVIDFRWYDPEPTGDDRNLNQKRLGAHLALDANGRPIPALNRFPSAADGAGFKPLADKLHSMGLKFGFHMMRGIPRQAAKEKSPIDGSSFTAADAADPKNTCGWCPDMFGVRANDAGQAWYDALYRLYASWGLDFVKVDDLSNPYHQSEIDQIRKAIDNCGRPIIFSTSPGPTSPKFASHVMNHANMWRVSGDFWDNWKKLDEQFDLLNHWQGRGGSGHWPDADMIPLGRIAIRSKCGGNDHITHFTRDEQLTLMSLWALAPSPLMLGMNLPDNDSWTLNLLTNDRVLAVNQDAALKQAVRVTKDNSKEVWVKELTGGDYAVGFFNRGPAEAPVELTWAAAGLHGKYSVRELWEGRDLGTADRTITQVVHAHGTALLRLSPAK